MTESESISERPTAAPSAPQWLLLALIVCAAAVLRFIYIGDTEPHWDELWHMELSTGRGSAHLTLPHNELIASAPDPTSLAGAPSWTKIPTSLDMVTHPPLYTMLLRFWRAAFGESVAIARGYSAILSALCVLALFEVARVLHGPTVALWTALVLAVASAQIDIAQDTRNYAQATLLCLCAAIAVVRIEAFGMTKSRLIALFSAALTAMFTHYFVVPVLMALALYALIRMPRRTSLSVCGTILIAACVFASVWGPFVLRQSEAFRGAVVPGALGEDDSQLHVKDWLIRLAAVPIRMLFEARKNTASFALAGVVMFALPWLLVTRNRALLLWSLWITSVVGLAAALDLVNRTKHLEQIRHTILAGPALAAALAALLAWPGARPAFAHGLPAVIVLACLLALPLSYTRQNPQFSDIGQALIADNDANANVEPVIFYADGPRDTWFADTLYLGAAHHSRTFPRPAARLDRPADGALIAQLRRWPRVWIVFGKTKLRPEEILPGCEVISQRGEPFLGLVCHVRWREDASP